MCKNRTQDFGVLISQQFILHGTFGKKKKLLLVIVPVLANTDEKKYTTATLHYHNSRGFHACYCW